MGKLIQAETFKAPRLRSKASTSAPISWFVTRWRFPRPIPTGGGSRTWGSAWEMHQMSMRPGGTRGVNGDITGNGNPITDQRDTSVGFLGMGGVKAHLFKYVAAFAEAKYVHAHHDGLLTDRFGQSTSFGANLTLNQYSSSINTILVHVGLSIHFDVNP